MTVEEFTVRARMLLRLINDVAAVATIDPSAAPDIHTLVALFDEQVDRLEAGAEPQLDEAAVWTAVNRKRTEMTKTVKRRSR